MKTVARTAKPLDTTPRSYRLSAEALEALEQMRLAWKAPKCSILDQAIIRLHKDWRAGKAEGKFLITDHSSSGGEE